MYTLAAQKQKRDQHCAPYFYGPFIQHKREKCCTRKIDGPRAIKSESEAMAKKGK